MFNHWNELALDKQQISLCMKQSKRMWPIMNRTWESLGALEHTENM